MAYVTIPKDLSRIQSKVLFGLTKRQVICFGAAALVGVPLFFLAKASLGTTTAALCMILVMLPFFLFAMYEKNGQPLEVFLGHLIQNKFIRPKVRIYQTNNLYSALGAAIPTGTGGEADCEKRQKNRQSVSSPVPSASRSRR